MDFHDALILLAIFTGLFYILRLKFRLYRFWTPAVIAVLIVWAAVVVIQTIFQRTPSIALEPIWQPFQSYIDALKEGGQKELLRSNFMNAVLFYPAGLLLASILPANWKPIAKVSVILVGFTAFSTAIELTQYRYCLGLAQTDDIIHNALGAVIGADVMLILSKIIKQKQI